MKHYYYVFMKDRTLGSGTITSSGNDDSFPIGGAMETLEEKFKSSSDNISVILSFIEISKSQLDEYSEFFTKKRKVK